ncbi:SsrA-binding protein SmpB [Chloroflexota bacterium]
MTNRTLATNKKAYHNFHIGESIEAGIALTGSEIKSARAGRLSLGDSYIRPDKGELWLFNAHIARNEASSYNNHEPTRSRKLLLHRKEINNLISQLSEKGLTLLPTRVYLKGHVAKVEVALAKGKKLYDKREAIAKKDMEREMGRTLKSNNY